MKIYKNCDAWWEGLTENQKMWIHRYFHDVEDMPKELFDENVINSHKFLNSDKGIQCGEN